MGSIGGEERLLTSNPSVVALAQEESLNGVKQEPGGAQMDMRKWGLELRAGLSRLGHLNLSHGAIPLDLRWAMGSREMRRKGISRWDLFAALLLYCTSHVYVMDACLCKHLILAISYSTFAQ
jgi:hypothetical protein